MYVQEGNIKPHSRTNSRRLFPCRFAFEFLFSVLLFQFYFIKSSRTCHLFPYHWAELKICISSRISCRIATKVCLSSEIQPSVPKLPLIIIPSRVIPTTDVKSAFSADPSIGSLHGKGRVKWDRLFIPFAWNTRFFDNVAFHAFHYRVLFVNSATQLRSLPCLACSCFQSTSPLICCLM